MNIIGSYSAHPPAGLSFETPIHQYSFTNKLLFLLAICNILMVVYLIWELRVTIGFLLTIKYNQNTIQYLIPLWINWLYPMVEQIVVLGITAWALLKRMHLGVSH
jgi:hypothetical protein